MNTKKVSVIIVAYKDGNILKDALDSIQRFNDLKDDLEVIIVDNSPENERIVKYVRQSKCRDCRYIANENKGFGYGNNRGAELASGEVLAFINPDVLLVEPLFQGVYDMFAADPKLMMLGCQLLDRNRSRTFSYYFDFESSIMEKLLTKVYNRFKIFDQKRMFTSGCNLFVRKSAFEKARGFDENVFMYNEEADLKRRILKEYPDGRIAFDKNHSLIHLGGSLGFSEKRFRLLKDSLIYFARKHGLNAKKKFRYEYRMDKLRCTVFRCRNTEKYVETQKEIECFEKYYDSYIK